MHVKDMVELGRKHPGVLAEFRKGHFLVQKTERKFSLIPKDHSHEQTTKTLKGASCVANIFDRPDTMDEHVMELPEKLQSIADFEAATDIVTGTTSSMFHGHHEEGQCMGCMGRVSAVNRHASGSFGRTRSDIIGFHSHGAARTLDSNNVQ